MPYGCAMKLYCGVKTYLAFKSQLYIVLSPGSEPAADRCAATGWRAVRAAADKVAVHMHVLGDAAPAHTGDSAAAPLRRHHRHGRATAAHSLHCSQWSVLPQTINYITVAGKLESRPLKR